MAAKKAVRARPKTGLAGAPKGNFESLKHYFQFEIDKKTYSKTVRDYAKARFTKDEVKAIEANPEWKFATYSHVAASCYWDMLGEEFPENYPAKERLLPEYFADLIEAGKKILAEKKAEEAVQPVRRLSPQELLARKVSQTVMSDIDDLEEAWLNGEKAKLDLYEAFRKHDLKGAAVEQVRRYLEPMLSEYDDALNKNCEQAVEGYAHLSKAELKRRVNVLSDMMSDLDSIKDASKAKRTVRKPKAKPIEKQVANVKYKAEDNELKLVSINPAQMVGAHRLLVLNSKYKTVTEYVTDAVSGFEIKGTTIQNFDPEKSRQKKLRKPEEFLPFVKKTAKQFDKAFTALTTKEAKPNGRLNDDTLILRAE